MRILLILTALSLAACGSGAGDPVGAPGPMTNEAVATAHTTRLPGATPEEVAISVTQTVYAATREENAVGAIILAPQEPATAFMAMHRVTHMPVNAPLLYLSPDGALSQATKDEMKRLRPDGVVQDGKTQVYAVGDIPQGVIDEIKDDLRYKVRRLNAQSPEALADLLDRWQAALKTDHPSEIAIAPLDAPDGIANGIGAMGWNAHMGRGFAWVYRDRIPDETRRILERRNRSTFIFLTAGSDMISDDVARELGEYGLVRRIDGDDVYSSNTVNAGYKDYGRDWGWWWDWYPREFGWGIAESGHNYIIGSPENILSVIPAATLGHMGKHGPILLVQPDAVPESVSDYLEMVRPNAGGPRQTIQNHAWIIGNTGMVSQNVQFEIDRLLREPGSEPEDLLGQRLAAAEQSEPPAPQPGETRPTPLRPAQTPVLPPVDVETSNDE